MFWWMACFAEWSIMLWLVSILSSSEWYFKFCWEVPHVIVEVPEVIGSGTLCSGEWYLIFFGGLSLML